jgi:hypothetical protein
VGDDRFKVIEGGRPDKPKRKRQARTLTFWECRVCETDIGVRTRSLIKVRHAPFEDQNLRITGGSDCWVCAMCLARGKFTQQTS